MKKFSIFVISYRIPRDKQGKLILRRCVDSILNTTNSDSYDLYVGLNACTEHKDNEPREYVSDLLAKGLCRVAIISGRNINKEGMTRIMLDGVLSFYLNELGESDSIKKHDEDEPRFIVQIDDDVHFSKSGWLDELENEIEADRDRMIGAWGRVTWHCGIKEGRSHQSSKGTAIGFEDLRKMTFYTGKPAINIPAISGTFICSRLKALIDTGYPQDVLPIYAEDVLQSFALNQKGWLVRNIPLAWDRKKVKIGDEEGVSFPTETGINYGSRTDRSKPRKIWDGDMAGIEVFQSTGVASMGIPIVKTNQSIGDAVKAEFGDPLTGIAGGKS